MGNSREIEVPLINLKQSGEEVSVGVPLDYEAGPKLGGAACVQVVDGLVSAIA